MIKVKIKDLTIDQKNTICESVPFNSGCLGNKCVLCNKTDFCYIFEPNKFPAEFGEKEIEVTE